MGLAPALQLGGRISSLRERGTSGGVRSRRLRAGIAIAEVALAMMVVAGAGLLVRSFVALTARDPGFVPDQVLSFNLAMAKLPDAASRARAAMALMDRLSRLPGVEAAGGATGMPAVTPQRGTRFEVADRPLTPGEDGSLIRRTVAGPSLCGSASRSCLSQNLASVISFNAMQFLLMKSGFDCPSPASSSIRPNRASRIHELIRETVDDGISESHRVPAECDALTSKQVAPFPNVKRLFAHALRRSQSAFLGKFRRNPGVHVRQIAATATSPS